MRRLLILCVLLCVGFAPAPLVRRDSAPPPLTHRTLAGTWEVRWGGGTYLMTFRPCGVYEERHLTNPARGVVYVGRWSLDGNTLDVMWSYVYEDGTLGDGVGHYRMKLAADWSGVDEACEQPVAFLRKRKE